MYMYIYIHICMKTHHVTVYDRNVVNKYGLYLLLGVMIYNLIDYIYIYIYVYIYVHIYTCVYVYIYAYIYIHTSIARK